MLTVPIRRKALLLLLAAVLAMPWPAAAVPIFEDSPAGRALTDLNLLDRLRGFLLGIWTKAGCHIDPNGIPQPPINQTKEGCHIDPNGVPRCTP